MAVVVVPPSAPDFPFDSSNSPTPYSSAPSTPRGLSDNYASAPASPSRIPFADVSNDTVDFAFEFNSGPLPPVTVTADELFHHGIIRPLKPAPRPADAIRIASPKGKAAMEETTRGRQMGNTSGNRRATRSLSPLGSVFGSHKAKAEAGAIAGSGEVNAWGWTWKLKDLLLFRSKSEGRVSGNRNKDVLRKYTMVPQITGGVSNEEVRNSSFRSTDGLGASARRVVARDSGSSVGGSSRRLASAHEVHYTTKRAAAKEQKRKTFLPYRPGLLDCLGFSPSIPIQDLAKSFGMLASHSS